MAFLFKPVNNFYISQREAREVVSRLIKEAVDAHKLANPTGFLSKTIVLPQGKMLSFEKESVYNTIITVNLDLNKPFNQKIKERRDDQSKSYTVMVDIGIKRVLDERAQSDIDLINEYLEKAICFNQYWYETTLTTAQGFDKNTTFKLNLQAFNKLESATQLSTQTMLQSQLEFLIKINRQ